MFGGEREPRITLARFTEEDRGEGPAVVRLTLTLSPTQKWWRGHFVAHSVREFYISLHAELVYQSAKSYVCLESPSKLRLYYDYARRK
jgi:hypothetical protein